MPKLPLVCPLLLAALLSAAAAQAPVPPPAPAPPPSTAAPLPTTLLPTVAPTTATPLPELLRALRQSPGWRGADLTYRAAELGLQSARARAGLSLSVGGSAALTRYPWDGGEWNANPALSATLALPVLPWAPQREALRRAERAVASAAVELRSSRASLTVQVAQAYASARGAAAALELARAQLALSERLLAVGQSQRAENLIPVTALLDRQTSAEQARASAEQARRALTLAATQLARLLGRGVTLADLPAEYAPLTALLPASWRTGEPPALETLIARALERRPEIARAQAALADAQAALSAAELDARLPDAALSVQAGQLAAGGGAAGRTVGGNFDLKSGTVGAQVNFPLKEPVTRGAAPGPDGQPVTAPTPSGVALSLSANFAVLGSGRTQASAQAQAATEQAALAVESARQGAELEVRSRFAEYENAAGALAAAQTGLTRATEQLAGARIRLQEGLGTALDVAQAEFALLQARSAADNIQAQLDLAALNLAQATGDLDPLLLTDLPALLPTP
ncbi:Outer membrane protein TolC [Deinococcus reticulitermitis]|uniref:Outer membrane protein TolC n=1 Tax=Deinococcus reticulitermitis TaxID=856736 RepID=A0A1H6WTF1_9DEIO|nr:TolC family protein [Deinococcus reticulitermitis]SEJ15772.1 Outer membrane protein TolC [Deinococcus reticulitermitis]